MVAPWCYDRRAEDRSEVGGVASELYCWRCGASLAELPVPLGRTVTCPACEADLHACRMCRFHDPGMTRGCREPMAEPLQERTRANFCDWFQARRGPWADGGEQGGRHTRAALDALFGLPAAGGDEAHAAGPEGARDALERLFGKDPGREG
jgi:hypothetical protein